MIYIQAKKWKKDSSIGRQELQKFVGALAGKGASTVMESLQGQVAGVDISQSSSRVGESFNIAIRGKSTLGSSTSPLFVVDGVICDDINFLNPSDIEKIDILKDASSTAIYGSRATNGVVIVTTKQAKVGDDMRTTVTYDGYAGYKTVALAGGVAANSGLREALERECSRRGVRMCRPDPVLCTDNGAMIGCRAYYMAQAGDFASLNLNADPRLPFLADQIIL